MLYDLIAGIISMIAKSLGVSYATANVAWSLYLQGLVCILSCLLLLIPMRKRYKQFGLDVFTICKRLRVYTLHNSKKAVTAD